MENKFNVGIKSTLYNQKLRELRGVFTQQELADKIGMNIGTYNSIERLGKFPSPEQANLIADYFGVEATELFPQWSVGLVGRRVPDRVIEVQRVSLESKEALRIEANNELEDHLSQEMLRDQVSDIMNKCLSFREIAVIKMRFGIDGKPSMTLEEVAREFGVTRERIRQIEAKAQRKMKRAMRDGGLK